MKFIMLSTIMVRLMIIMTVQFNFSILRINGSIWCREYVLYRCVSKGWISRDGQESFWKRQSGKRVILISCAENSLNAIIFNFNKRKMMFIMLSTIMVLLMIIMSVQFNFSILRINGSIRCREYVLYRCVSKGWISRDWQERDLKRQSGKRVILISCAGNFSKCNYFQF